MVDRLCGHTFLRKLLNSDSTAVDLGAHKGQFSHGMIARYGCRVFAAEPIAELRAGISMTPGLTIFPFAIGGGVGRARMHVFGSRCASLLLERAEEMWEREEEVELLDLRNVLARFGLAKVDLMKVDIEGAELAMFESASDTELRGFTQITVEFHDFLYPEQKSRVEAIKRRFRKLGFWVIKFSLDNTDVLFVNAAASGTGRFQYGRLKYFTKYVEGAKRRWAQRLEALGAR